MELSDRNRLNQVLASYGADPERWPEGERQRLLELLRKSDVDLQEARDIDLFLNRASAVAVPANAGLRLMWRIGEGAQSKIVPFPSPKRGSPFPWLSALPLAASVALGIYLGASGKFDNFLPASLTGEVAGLEDDDADLSGASTVTDYSGDDVS